MSERAYAEDRCPFSRDFHDRFDACPAFESTVSVVADSTGRVLRPVLTCKLLTIGQSSPGRFYPRCAAGVPKRLEEEVREATGTD